MKTVSKTGVRWASVAMVVAISAAVTAGCASASPAPAGDEASPTADVGASIDPASAESCALLAVKVEEAADKVADGFRVLDGDPQSAIVHFEEAATSFNADDDEWVGEAATAADQFGAGLDELTTTMRASVDGSAVDVASAESAANTFTQESRDAMDRCMPNAQ